MRNYSIRPRDDGRAAKRVLAMPLARRNGWFDDEIAIDFPSLHAAVERMRACFVAASNEGDHARRLSTELAPVAARSLPRRHGAARRAGAQAVRRLRRARRNLVRSRATLAMAAAKRSAAIPFASSSRRECRTAIDLPSRFLLRPRRRRTSKCESCSAELTVPFAVNRSPFDRCRGPSETRERSNR